LRRRPAEAIGAPGDEDGRHALLLELGGGAGLPEQSGLKVLHVDHIQPLQNR
jgi:hypothetical protein